MLKKTTLILALPLALLAACSSDSDSDSDSTVLLLDAGVAGVYEGYAEGISGAAQYQRAFLVDSTRMLMQVLDDNDAQSTGAGSVDGHLLAFGDTSCEASADALSCNGFLLGKTTASAVTVASLAGSYEGVDTNNQAWEMSITDDGSFTATPNSTSASCSVTGSFTSEAAGSLAVASFSASGCESDGESYGVATLSDLTAEADVINLMTASGELQMHWFKN